MKRFIIFSMILFLLSVAAGFFYYEYTHRTVECWWSSIYPSLSFIAFDDDGTDNIEYKFAIIEWFKNNVL